MNTLKRAPVPATQVIGWAAAACWLTSWFLPVVDDYPGWAAFWAALNAPFRGAIQSSAEDSVPSVLSALTNVVFLALWLGWARQRMTRATLFLKMALTCLLVNLYWLVQALRDGNAGDLLGGYYAWLAAFALLLALAILNVVSARRTSRTPTAGMPS